MTKPNPEQRQIVLQRRKNFQKRINYLIMKHTKKSTDELRELLFDMLGSLRGESLYMEHWYGDLEK